MTFRKSDKKTLQFFQDENVEVVIHHKTFNGKQVRYIETGTSNRDLIIFVHGAPGGSDAYADYLSDSLLLQKAKLVSIDRLGYGYSNYGRAEKSITEQAALVNFVCDQYDNDRIYLVGHSYGGPIVAQQLITHPDKIKAVMMIAPVNDPRSEKVFWYARFGKWKLTRWTLSKALRVATDEKFSHINELEKMENQWANIQKPVIHIHGTKDGLASFDNIAFSKKHIPDSFLTTVEMKGKGHMIIWSEQEIIKEMLLELVGNQTE